MTPGVDSSVPTGARPTLRKEGEKRSAESRSPARGKQEASWIDCLDRELSALRAAHAGALIAASHQRSGELMNDAFPSDFLPHLLAGGNID